LFASYGSAKKAGTGKSFSIFFYSRENDLQDGFLHSKLDHPRMHPLVVPEVETAIHRSET
jgi:hypothetical protein